MVIEVDKLAGLPIDAFLVESYRTILGRSADIDGLWHYAKNLDDGFPRRVVIIELASSEEGVIHNNASVFSYLERHILAYNKVAKLPLGKLRWLLIPKLKGELSDKRGLWGDWLRNYVTSCSKSFDSQYEKTVPNNDINVSSRFITTGISNNEFYLDSYLSMVDAEHKESRDITEDELHFFSDELFIALMYRTIFNRPVDQDGFKIYSDMLRDKRQRKIFIETLINSDEGASCIGMRNVRDVLFNSDGPLNKKSVKMITRLTGDSTSRSVLTRE